jgi:hypothetical protein
VIQKLIPILLICSTLPASASELIFQFNSPSFSGQGYSTHVLTIEQLEQQRRDRIRADEQTAIDRAERELRGTNAYKFQNNLESRIYAQLSRQIADSVFGEGGLNDDFGILETPFGDIIEWSRNDNQISIIIRDSNGNTVSEFTVPIGEFAF